MTFLESRGLRIHYRFEGRPGAPVLLLSNSLGTDLHLWDKVLPAISARFRVLRYDTRGHGQSSVPPGPYSIELLAADVLALLDHLDIEQCFFCGISLGGMTGIWMGIHAAQRTKKLVIANSASRIGTYEGWNDRIQTVETKGLESLADAIIDRWFSPEFQSSNRTEVETIRETLVRTDPQGYAACCAAIRDTDLSRDLNRIETPSLVVAATGDPAVPPADSRLTHERIKGSSYLELPCKHISVVERAEEFAKAILHFFEA